jgi:heme/copper-type cytochrome/quinol oxidase subunit 2
MLFEWRWIKSKIMLPIVALIAIVVVILFIVFAMKKKNREQDLGDPKAGR